MRVAEHPVTLEQIIGFTDVKCAGFTMIAQIFFMAVPPKKCKAFFGGVGGGGLTHFKFEEEGGFYYYLGNGVGWSIFCFEEGWFDLN